MTTTDTRAAAREEQGFTLVELLVVILIIGVLAAIAIPSFLDQKGKAEDTTAKEMARTASQAAETYENEHSGNYTGMDVKALHEYETAIQTAEGNNNAWLQDAESIESGQGYKVTSIAPRSKDTFTITRAANGELKRTCTSTGTEGGCRTGVW